MLKEELIIETIFFCSLDYLNHLMMTFPTVDAMRIFDVRGAQQVDCMPYHIRYRDMVSHRYEVVCDFVTSMTG